MCNINDEQTDGRPLSVCYSSVSRIIFTYLLKVQGQTVDRSVSCTDL